MIYNPRMLTKVYRALGSPWRKVRKQRIALRARAHLALVKGTKLWLPNLKRIRCRWGLDNLVEATGGIRHSAGVVKRFIEEVWRRLTSGVAVGIQRDATYRSKYHVTVNGRSVYTNP